MIITLTRLAMYGDIAAPVRAHRLATATPEVLMTVGKSSDVYSHTMAKLADVKNRPNRAKPVISHVKSVM